MVLLTIDIDVFLFIHDEYSMCYLTKLCIIPTRKSYLKSNIIHQLYYIQWQYYTSLKKNQFSQNHTNPLSKLSLSLSNLHCNLQPTKLQEPKTKENNIFIIGITYKVYVIGIRGSFWDTISNSTTEINDWRLCYVLYECLFIELFFFSCFFFF
jgi:hypothetical protein